MSVVRSALSARRLIEENAALALLRSANAPAAIAILGEHLAAPLKLLQVLEDYVGGIALVTSPDCRTSYASEVSIDDRRLGAVATRPAADQQMLFGDHP